MLYVIIHWTGKEWIIDHYTHKLEDALRWYEHYRLLYQKDCRLMVDDRIIHLHEENLNSKYVQEKSAEVRRHVSSIAERLEDLRKSGTGTE